MKPFTRRVPIGKVDTGYKVKAIVSVDIDWNGTNLTITGDATRPGPGDRMDSAGQILGDVAETYPLFISARDRDTLIEVWNAWHLNDMRAGCEHQRRFGWGEKRIPDFGNKWAGHVYRHEHPNGVLMEPCGICGYQYGSKRLHEVVPEDVLQWLHDFARTDDEDRTI